jgi:hypothetical protein
MQQTEVAAAAAAEPVDAAGTTAPAAVAAEVCNDGAAQIDAINSQLQRHMRLRNIQAQATNCILLGHMTKLQMARILVGELHAHMV